MTVQFFHGGWYADALPSGEYAVIYPDHRGYMDTHLGRVPFMSSEHRPLFPRITNRRGFRVAGQFRDFETLEWSDVEGWTVIPMTACGVSPVIYDRAGHLHISDCSIGSQGWRYVERGTGRLVTGDNTYGPRHGHALFEWTDLGDGLFVGQGPFTGVGVWDGSVHRQLADGICRFIRADRDGDRISVAYWREDGPSACYWLTVAELRALPIVDMDAPPPPPPPPPTHEDDMTDAQVRDLFARLTRIEHSIADMQEDVDEIRMAIEETPQNPPDTPPPPPSTGEPVIDLKAVHWLHADVSDWAQTSTITDVSIRHPKNGDHDNGEVCFPHTKAGKWPTFDGGSGEGNVWVFGQFNGEWYAATCEWLRPGQFCKRFSNRTEPLSWGIGPHTKKEPLKSWGPRSGEWFGLMVSTRARDGERSRDAFGNPVLERSQVYLTRWP